jgi:uncharacterized protein YkwD
MSADENSAPEEWLQLTEEDIERAQSLARAEPPEPEIITILDDDIRDVADGEAGVDSRVIAITLADLAPSPEPTEVDPDLRLLEALMFDVINATRREHLPRWVGTAELTWHDELARVARQHSTDMLRRQYVAHVTPEGITAAQRLQRKRINYLACGENIGIVYGAAAHSQQGIHDIQTAFMRQPRNLTNHRGNLLNPIWTHVGVGIAYNPDGALVATQNFISAPGRRLRNR